MPKKIIEKTCEICCLIFKPKRSIIRCCSQTCTRKLQNLTKHGVKEEKPITPCETCGITPEKKYSTGRFCSKKCACSFSTSHAREKISEKTRQTLQKKYEENPITSIQKKTWEAGDRKNLCDACSQPFEVAWDKRHIKTCSKTCYIKNMSNKMIQRNIDGNFFQSFGRRVKYINYGQDIHCDSLIEWCALEDFFQKYGKQIISATRSEYKIPYIDENGNQRSYNPDFDIVLSNGERFCVECKSEQFGLNETWSRYQKEATLKKELLETFCKDNGITSVWFTQKTRKDLYCKLKESSIKS